VCSLRIVRNRRSRGLNINAALRYFFDIRNSGFIPVRPWFPAVMAAPDLCWGRSLLQVRYTAGCP
jgi:hypothetical protein